MGSNAASLNSEHKKRFLKIFDSMTGKHSRWEIWQDFVQLAAISISALTDKANEPERAKTYRHITAKYSSEESKKFSELFGEVITGLDENPNQDFLGALYMECGLGSDHTGQFFTPYHISALLAQLTAAESPENAPCGFITVNEPSCGAGASIIAYANMCQQHGVFYPDDVLFVAQDIDMVVGLMCYIQISLLGCAGYVIIGNSLCDPAVQLDRHGLIPAGPQDRIWYTPAFATDLWTARRKIAEMEVLEKQLWKKENLPKAYKTGS